MKVFLSVIVLVIVKDVFGGEVMGVSPAGTLDYQFHELNKKCVKIASVRKEHFWKKIQSEIVVEVNKSKDAVKNLRKVYEKRLTKLDELQKTIYIRDETIKEYYVKIKECKDEKSELSLSYKELMITIEKLTIQIKNLKADLDKATSDKDVVDKELQIKYKQLQEITVQLNMYKVTVMNLKEEIQVLEDSDSTTTVNVTVKRIQKELSVLIDSLHNDFLADIEKLRAEMNSYVKIQIQTKEEECRKNFFKQQQKLTAEYEKRIQKIREETETEISQLTTEIHEYKHKLSKTTEELEIVKLKLTGCQSTLGMCETKMTKSVNVTVEFGKSGTMSIIKKMLGLYDFCLKQIESRDILGMDVTTKDIEFMEKELTAGTVGGKEELDTESSTTTTTETTTTGKVKKTTDKN